MFKDITPVLSDPELFRASIDLFPRSGAEGGRSTKSSALMHAVFCSDPAVAYELGLGFIPITETWQTPLHD